MGVTLVSVASKLGAVALVVFLLLLVIPLGIGMVMAPCPACDVGLPMPTATACLSILIAFGLLVAPRMMGAFRLTSPRLSPLLLARDLDPPPRFI